MGIIKFLSSGILFLGLFEARAENHNPFTFGSGHGLVFGQGRSSAKGLHLHDSLSLSLREFTSMGKFSQNLNVSTNTGFQKGKLQDAATDFSLRYKYSGFALSGIAGFTYSSLVYNPYSRKEKSNLQSVLYSHFALTGSKKFSLDADSTWALNFSAGYDDLGGEFRTLDASTYLDKTLGDFDFTGFFSGYQQKQKVTTPICGNKILSKKNCIDSISESSNFGFGSSFDIGWDLDPHTISTSVGLDWASAQDSVDVNATVLNRTISFGLGYDYSLWSWCDLGFFYSREILLDGAAKSKTTLIGVSFSVYF